jgi:hypothetical protein
VRCDDARLALSLRLDGEAPEGVDEDDVRDHVDGCGACTSFERTAVDVRTGLRFEPVDAAPDVAPGVVASLAAEAGGSDPRDRLRPRPRSLRSPGRRGRARRSLVAAAACAAVAGFVAGAVFVGTGRDPRSPAAADLPQRVVAAQSGITSLDARFRIVERALPPADGRPDPDEARVRDGWIVYEAPESLALTVGGESGTRLIVDGEEWWQASARRCSPAAGSSTCSGGATRWVRSVSGRAPFSDQAPVPLELVSPVDSFTLAAVPSSLGSRRVAGRDAIGVRVTAAQVAPLLDGLAPAGLRAVHPTDQAELWLDRDHLVPLELTVRASDDPARPRWAAERGLTESAGDVVVSFTVGSATINGPVDRDVFALPTRPPPDERVDAGFRPDLSSGDTGSTSGRDGSAAVAPSPLPDGFARYRSGVVVAPGAPDVTVTAYTDGRAWFTVRTTTEWAGRRLFGSIGASVRAVDLGDAGVGYASDDGRSIAVHGAGIDVAVSGSLPLDELLRLAASLGVTGIAVPASWDEAASASLDQAAAAADELLVARGLEGFGSPAVRISGDTVTQVYAGAGDRGFTLVQSADDQLPPPPAADAVGVEVRGVEGRYGYDRGQLEWVERGSAHSVASQTLSLGELLAIAEALAPM